MTAYAVLYRNRHTDPEIRLYLTLQAANRWFDEVFRAFPEAKESPRGSWLRHAQLTEEGDDIRMELLPLNDPLER